MHVSGLKREQSNILLQTSGAGIVCPRLFEKQRQNDMTTISPSWDNVPATFALCVHRQCPMAAQCLRATAYNLLPADEQQAVVVNPKTCSQKADCIHFRSNVPMLYAQGFAGMQRKIQPEAFDQFRSELMMLWGRRGYYRRRSGELLLPEAEQDLVRQALLHAGIPATLPFDSMVEQLPWYI